MGSSMSLEFIAPCEPLSTEEPVADKGSLASVQADMGPKQGCLPESLSAVGDVAHMLLLALLPRPEGLGSEWGEEVGRERSHRRAGQDLSHSVTCGTGVWVWPRLGTLPLLPILAVGTCAGHAPPFLPRLGLSC